MRVPSLALLMMLLLAGCLAERPGEGVAEASVAAEAFARTDAEWAAMNAGGCGLCSGAGGFGPHAEHYAFFVFRDARLLLVEFNERPDTEGFHVHEDVTYDEDQLRSLLDDVPRASAGETWVVRTVTGRALDETLPQRLDARWTTPGSEQPAADYGVTYGHLPEDGEPEVVELRGPLDEEDPFNEFSGLLNAYERALRDVGVQRGAPPPDSS